MHTYSQMLLTSYGVAAPSQPVFLQPITSSSTAYWYNTATAAFSFGSDGEAYINSTTFQGTLGSRIFTWLLSGTTSDYVVKVIKTSGTVSNLSYWFPTPGQASGSTTTFSNNTWYSLTNQVTLSISAGNPGIATYNGTIYLGYASDNTIITSTSISFYAETIK